MPNSSAATQSSDATPAVRTVVRPDVMWRLVDLREAWKMRELLYFLVWRDVKIRYKQTVLGATWAVLQPILTAAIFAVVFGRFAKMPSDGHPYALFAYVGLLPWQLFSFTLTESTNSIVVNQQLIKKVYFPRIFLPLTPVIVGLVDFTFSLGVLIAIMAFYGVDIRPAMALTPLLVLFSAMTAFAVGLWTSALNVQFRDIRYTVPFLIQVWFFATPIVYSASVIPERYRALWGINPMTGVVVGFRWLVLGDAPPSIVSLLVSGLVVVLLLLGGLLYFRRVEVTMADKV